MTDSSTKFVFVDVDHTVYDNSTNLPIEPTIGLVRALMEHYAVVFITYRTEDMRVETLKWLKANVEKSIQSNQLVMRIPNTDESTFPVEQMKLFQVLELVDNDVDNVLMIIDDQPKTCAMFQTVGIQAMQPHRSDNYL
jgi:hypothetical protein